MEVSLTYGRLIDHLLIGAREQQGDGYNIPYNNDLQNSDLLDTFDFEQFLDNNAFAFDPSQFDSGEMLEAPMGDTA